MAEYYERESVAEFIRSYRHSTDVAFHMEEHLYEIPPADVRPVVRGRWSLEKITDAYGGDVWHRWKCSECDAVCATGWEHTRDGAKPKYNFCHNCGADMRETDEARRLKKQLALNELGYPYDLPKGE